LTFSHSTMSGMDDFSTDNVGCWQVWQFYAKGWEAKNESKICGRIKRKLKEIDVTVVKTRMRGVRINVQYNYDVRFIRLGSANIVVVLNRCWRLLHTLKPDSNVN
jgi:hypothetical protein